MGIVVGVGRSKVAGRIRRSNGSEKNESARPAKKGRESEIQSDKVKYPKRKADAPSVKLYYPRYSTPTASASNTVAMNNPSIFWSAIYTSISSVPRLERERGEGEKRRLAMQTTLLRRNMAS